MPKTKSSEPLWYIIQTYSGHEERVKNNLNVRIDTMDAGDKVLQVIVPTEQEVEIKNGRRTEVGRKLYPGYIIVQMKMDDSSWHVVRNTPGVTGFISSEDEHGNRNKPTPLDDTEVQTIIDNMERAHPRLDVGFTNGQAVRITDGPFMDFMGTVDEINVERSKATVLVSFFGRETPVEVDLLQIEKA